MTGLCQLSNVQNMDANELHKQDMNKIKSNNWIKSFVFSVFASHVIKTKNCNHYSINKVKNLGNGRWLIYKQPREESGLCCFHSPVVRRSVLPRFIELCMETPCLCPSKGHKHGHHKVTETSAFVFCRWNEKLLH